MLASFSGLLLASLALLAWSLRGWDPPGDEAAYGFGLIMLSFLLVLAEILALGLGVAGTLQPAARGLSPCSVWRAAPWCWQ